MRWGGGRTITELNSNVFFSECKSAILPARCDFPCLVLNQSPIQFVLESTPQRLRPREKCVSVTLTEHHGKKTFHATDHVGR